MRRIATTALVSLAALALVAPAAHAGTQVRQFEAFGITLEGPGASSPRIGDIAINVVFKNKRAGGKYTPRRLTRLRISNLPLFCSVGGNPPPLSPRLDADLSPNVKFTTAKPPVKPKANRYAFRWVWDWGGFATGYFNGTIDKANGKGWPRAHGKFGIDRYDFPPPGPSGCEIHSQGWSAKTQCKRPGQSGDLPLCRFD